MEPPPRAEGDAVSRYAGQTNVAPGQSRAEIERTLERGPGDRGEAEGNGMIEQNRTRYIVHCDSCPEVERPAPDIKPRERRRLHDQPRPRAQEEQDMSDEHKGLPVPAKPTQHATTSPTPPKSTMDSISAPHPGSVPPADRPVDSVYPVTRLAPVSRSGNSSPNWLEPPENARKAGNSWA